MNAAILKLLCLLPQQAQRQDATTEQLRDLVVFANRLGMYDAADLLTTMITKADRNSFDQQPSAL